MRRAGCPRPVLRERAGGEGSAPSPDLKKPSPQPSPGLPGEGARDLIVINKIDRLGNAIGAALTDWPHAIQISALSGQGIPRLIEQIHRRFGLINFDPTKSRWWTQRQRDFLGTIEKS